MKMRTLEDPFALPATARSQPFGWSRHSEAEEERVPSQLAPKALKLENRNKLFQTLISKKQRNVPAWPEHLGRLSDSEVGRVSQTVVAAKGSQSGPRQSSYHARLLPDCRLRKLRRALVS
jgi:hypothetical protein